jgi:predicted Zn-dependent peptidase
VQRAAITSAIAIAFLSVNAAAQQSSFDRTKPPTLGPAPDLTLPKITEKTLANGLRLIVVEQRELPLVDIFLVAKTGAEAEPAAKGGMATLMGSLMTEGAGSRNSQQIAEQMAFLGVRVSAYSTWDQSGVSLHAPKAVLDSALALFADIALRPTFPAADFDRLKKQRMTQLMQVADRGPSLADRAYYNILFGDGHPYGHPVAGIETTVGSLTRDDIAAFYKSVFIPNNAFVVVVGDISVADAEKRMNDVFGSWAKGTPVAVTYTPPAARTERRIYVVDKASAPQASFRMGGVGAARTSPDYYSIMVMNTVLGGSFTSRLNQHLREDKGYTYGASSGFALRKEPGPFVARAEIVSGKSDSALFIFMNDLESMRTSVPAEELDKAKKYLQLGLPGEFETTGAIASQLASYALYGLPLDEPTRAVSKIGAVTEGEVIRVATTYLNPATFAIVVAGDAKTLVPMLRKTGLGPVELRDGYGKPIPARVIVP